MKAPRKHAVLVTPASFTNGATATGYVDTKGFDYLEIEITAATANVVSNSPSVCKLQESDTTDATNFADITGAVGGTSFTIGNDLTSLPNQRVFCVDLRARKRYIQVAVSPRTTQIMSVTAQLGRGEQASVTAAKAGVQALVTI